MSTTSSAPSPRFTQAVAHTLGVLTTVSGELSRQRRNSVVNPDPHGLLHLEGLVILASYRGRHFAGNTNDQLGAAEDQQRDLYQALSAVHEELANSVTGLEPRELLEFVDEVGAICQGVRRHVQDH